MRTSDAKRRTSSQKPPGCLPCLGDGSVYNRGPSSARDQNGDHRSLEVSQMSTPYIRSQPEVSARGRVNSASETGDQPVSSGQQKGGAEGPHVLGLHQEVTVSYWGDPWNPAAFWSPAREQVQGRAERAPRVGRDLHPAL